MRGEVTALAGGGLRAVAALQHGEVVVSTDGGGVWGTAGPLPGRPLVTALLLLPRELLAGTAGRGLWHGNGAGGWHASGSTLLTDRTVLALARRGSVVLAGTLRAGVFRSTDGGHSWSPASVGLPFHGRDLEVTQLVATRRVWYALHPLGVSQSVDGGLRWRSVAAGLPPHRAPSVLAALGDALVAEVEGFVYRLGPSDRWVESRTGPVRFVGEDGGGLFAALADGRTVGRSTDAGHSWARMQRGLPRGSVVTAFAATQRLVLAALDGEGVWSRPAPVPPDAIPGLAPDPHPASTEGDPVEASLRANEPNPFTHATSIPFVLSADAHVVLSVHDVSGAEIVRLAEGVFPPGEHRLVFEGASFSGGLYHARLYVGGQRYDRAMVLLR